MKKKRKQLKKISLLVLIVFCLFITGCTKKEESGTDIKSSTVKENTKGTLKCTREATVSNGSANFSYTLSYKNGYVENLVSIEEVSSSDSSVLTEYEDAYNKIKSYYEGLNDYNITVLKTDSKVTNTTTIDYTKVDMDKLLEIEGSEDNVIENGKVKLKTWLTFAEKLGVTCQEA